MATVVSIRILLLVAASFLVQGEASETPAEPPASATVGAPRVLKDIVLPGSELVAKPLAGDPEMIVQVVDAIKHGDSYRYTIRFSGLEPGPHDLADWLVRLMEASPVKSRRFLLRLKHCFQPAR